MDPGGSTCRTAVTAAAQKSDPLRLLLLLALVLIVTSVVAAAPALAYESWEHARGRGVHLQHAAAAIRTARRPTPRVSRPACHGGMTTSGAQLCWQCHEPGNAPDRRLLGQLSPLSRERREPRLRRRLHARRVAAPGRLRLRQDVRRLPPGRDPPRRGGHRRAVLRRLPQRHARQAAAGLPQRRAAHRLRVVPRDDHEPAFLRGLPRGQSFVRRPPGHLHERPLLRRRRCHGKIKNHVGTTSRKAACTDCHTAHYQSLGACTKCHTDPQTFHHATTAGHPARPVRHLPRRRHRQGAVQPHRLRHRLRELSHRHGQAVSRRLRLVPRRQAGVHGAAGHATRASRRAPIRAATRRSRTTPARPSPRRRAPPATTPTTRPSGPAPPATTTPTATTTAPRSRSR